MVRNWSVPTALTFLDQGTSSGANFVLNLVLARHLSPDGYGAFAVGFSIYLFLASLGVALLLEPMAVLGPRTHRRDLAGYASRLFIVQAVLSAVFAVVLAAAGLVAGRTSPGVSSAALWFAGATPLLMLFTFLRRACYLETNPAAAFLGSAVYAVVLLGMLWRAGSGDSVAGAVIAMGLASLAGGIVIAVERGLPGLLSRGISWTAAWRDFAGCWGYGKWLLGTMVVGWLSGAAYVPLAAAFAGLGAAGTLKAVDNFFMPVNQGMTALGLLASPWLARRMGERGVAFVRSRMWALGLVVAAAVGVWVFGVWWFGGPLVALVYGKETPYLAALGIIPILGAVYMIRGLADNGLNTGLRAMGDMRAVFRAVTAGSVVMLAASVPLLRRWGAAGAAGAMLLAGLTQLAFMIPPSLTGQGDVAGKKGRRG